MSDGNEKKYDTSNQIRRRRIRTRYELLFAKMTTKRAEDEAMLFFTVDTNDASLALPTDFFHVFDEKNRRRAAAKREGGCRRVEDNGDVDAIISENASWNNDDDDVQEDFLLAPHPPREDDDDDREDDEGIFFLSIMCC